MSLSWDIIDLIKESSSERIKESDREIRLLQSSNCVSSWRFELKCHCRETLLIWSNKARANQSIEAIAKSTYCNFQITSRACVFNWVSWSKDTNDVIKKRSSETIEKSNRETYCCHLELASRVDDLLLWNIVDLLKESRSEVMKQSNQEARVLQSRARARDDSEVFWWCVWFSEREKCWLWCDDILSRLFIDKHSALQCQWKSWKYKKRMRKRKRWTAKNCELTNQQTWKQWQRLRISTSWRRCSNFFWC